MAKKTLSGLVILCVFLAIFILPMTNAQLNNPNTDWLSQAKYGVGFHYLEDKITLNGSWNNTVNLFNVTAFVNNVVATGAKYVIFTLGQNSGYYCSPNAKLDSYSGYAPGDRNSTRDLPAELATALNAKGIKLILYLPSNCPNNDSNIANAFGLTTKDSVTGNWIVNSSFSAKWAQVIQEWSDRYGTKVAGWWFDGFYRTECGFVDSDAKNYSDAAKHGNSQAIIAVNERAAEFGKVSDYQDYLSGERTDLNTVCTGRWYSGVQWHTFTRLASGWFSSGCQFNNTDLINYIKTCSSNGGATTWNMLINADGTMDLAQLNQMKAINTAIYGNGTPTPTPIPTVGPTPTPTGANLALNQPVTCSSEQTGNEASHMVDGDATNTRWSASPYPQWAQIDLGTVYSISRTELAPYSNRAYQYKIEVSTDGTNYTRIIDRTTNTVGASLLTDTFAAINARYVKLTVTGCSAYTGTWISINEFRVFADSGVPTVTPTPVPTSTSTPTPTIIVTPSPTPTIIITPSPTPTPTIVVTPSPTPTIAPTSTPGAAIKYECENLTTITSGPTEATQNDTNASGGANSKFSSTKVGDWVQYTVNVAAAGTYNVKACVRKNTDKGICQTYIDGAAQGAVIDQYASGSAYVVTDLGKIFFSTAGNKLFKFQVTGKNSSSSGYGLSFDYILLTPQ